MNFPNLEELYLKSTSLKELSIEKLPLLKILHIESTFLSKIEGLENCLNLEEFRFRIVATMSAPTFLVKEDYTHLKVLDLERVEWLNKFEELLGRAPNLEKLQMYQVGPNRLYNNAYPETLFLNRQYDALKTIRIVYSALVVKGFDHCPNLEEIDLQGTEIRGFELKSPHQGLRKVNLSRVKQLESLEGMDNCPTLKELDLSESNFGGTVTFEKDNKELVLRGMRKSQIKGIEHLDETKTEWLQE